MTTSTSVPSAIVLAGRRRFSGISSRAWEHPADRAALMALRAVPGFDLAIRWFFGMFTERAIRALVLGGAVQVGPNQFPRLNALWQECISVLDAPQEIELYVSQSPVLNAGATGWDKPFVVVNSAAVQILSDDQLRYVLAHELGHILSGHVLYKTMLHILMRVSLLAMGTPLTGVAMLAVLAALLEWDRKSELSADRAGLLVCQNPDDVRHGLLRMAGGLGEGANLDAFREQARRFEQSEGIIDQAVKIMAVLGQRHPFPVQRLLEVDRWVESGEYQAILDGRFPLKKDDPSESAFTAWKETAAHYSDAAKSTAEPVGKWIRETTSGASKRAKDWWAGKGKGKGEGEAGE